jgi:hypothetical protein
VVAAGTGPAPEVEAAVDIAVGEAAQLQGQGNSACTSAAVSRVAGGVEADDAPACSSHWASDRYLHQGMCDAASSGLLLPAALSCPSSCSVGGSGIRLQQSRAHRRS